MGKTADMDHDNLVRLRSILNLKEGGEGRAESLPFGVGDATAGAENELLTVVTGPR